MKKRRVYRDGGDDLDSKKRIISYFIIYLGLLFIITIFFVENELYEKLSFDGS